MTTSSTVQYIVERPADISYSQNTAEWHLHSDDTHTFFADSFAPVMFKFLEKIQFRVYNIGKR